MVYSDGYLHQICGASDDTNVFQLPILLLPDKPVNGFVWGAILTATYQTSMKNNRAFIVRISVCAFKAMQFAVVGRMHKV
jgi:hypothetical protein